MLTAWVTDALDALRTALAAQIWLRPWLRASSVMRATASFVIFLPRVVGRSCPLLSMTDAAPMLVLGAMAATSPARVTKVAALPARAPSGATQVMTGTLLPRMASRMLSMLV